MPLIILCNLALSARFTINDGQIGKVFAVWQNFQIEFSTCAFPLELNTTNFRGKYERSGRPFAIN